MVKSEVEDGGKGMTRGEAINELEILKENYWDDDGYGHETKQYDDTMLALDMAIKALEQEPATNNNLGVDCISRAALYDRIKGIDHDEDYECDEFGGSRITYHTCDWDEVLREIEDAPSITPQEPRWIPVSERLPESDEEYHTFLVTDNKGRVTLSEFYLSISDRKPYWSGMIDVLAWMPLPKSYSGVEE